MIDAALLLMLLRWRCLRVEFGLLFVLSAVPLEYSPRVDQIF